MAQSTYLQLTNRVLKALNEVQLTSTTFSSAVGFVADVLDGINQAIFDICTYQDTEWPFLWSTTTFQTVAGQTDYIRSDTFSGINWDSFRVQRFTFPSSAIVSITTNLTTKIATITTVNPHLLITGDVVSIWGATDLGYNSSSSVITVTSPTVFTTPTSATTTPASGPLLVICENVPQLKLQIQAWDQYMDSGLWDKDQNTDPTGYQKPRYAVRKLDNNIYIDGPPDRAYIIYYEGFTLPGALVNYTDTCLIPQQFEQVIIDKALHYAYMFRDNVEEAALVQKRYEDNIFKMRRILIPQETFAVATE